MPYPRGGVLVAGAGPGVVVVSESQSVVSRAASALLSPLQSECTRVLGHAQSAALWSLHFWSLLVFVSVWVCVVACCSACTYAALYRSVMPPYSASLPVHFDVSSALVPPHATVQLAGAHQWLDATRASAAEQAEARAAERYMVPGHLYDLSLQLVFPDAAVNHAAGMQSVEMLVLHEQTLLASSLHAFTPRYSSPLVRWMWRWLMAGPLLLGLVDERQSVELHMFEQLLEHAHAPTTSIKVLLKSPLAHKFQLYSATLRLQVQLTGLRYYMYHWFVTTAVILTSLIFLCQLFWSGVVLLALGLWCCGGRALQREREDEAEALAHVHAAPPAALQAPGSQRARQAYTGAAHKLVAPSKPAPLAASSTGSGAAAAGRSGSAKPKRESAPLVQAEGSFASFSPRDYSAPYAQREGAPSSSSMERLYPHLPDADEWESVAPGEVEGEPSPEGAYDSSMRHRHTDSSQARAQTEGRTHSSSPSAPLLE